MRSVPEWIGKNDDAMPTEACKRRILDRQGWKCAITEVEFRDGVKAEFDHIVPLWLGGENRENNLQAISKKAHADKTATEAGVRAKVNANRIKRVGARTAPAKPIRSAGFPKSPKSANRQPKAQLPYRPLYSEETNRD